MGHNSEAVTETASKGYKEALAVEHETHDNWGSTAGKYAGPWVLSELETNKQITNLLDYGCGKMALRAYLDEKQPVEYHGYDPAFHMQVPKGQYDLVTCIDVLEHVEKEFIEAVIKELGDKTKYTLLLDIACYPTGKVFTQGVYEGEDLHISIYTPLEWICAVEKLLWGEFKLRMTADVSKWQHGEQRKRCLMILDRRY